MLNLFQCVSVDRLAQEGEIWWIVRLVVTGTLELEAVSLSEVRSNRVCLNTKRKADRLWVCYGSCPGVVTNGSYGIIKKQRPETQKQPRQYVRPSAFFTRSAREARPPLKSSLANL